MSPDPLVLEHYRRCAAEWCGLELPDLAVTLAPPDGLQLGLFHLRLQPESCLWILTEDGQAFTPSRTCLSLVDWLAQIRRRITLPSG